MVPRTASRRLKLSVSPKNALRRATSQPSIFSQSAEVTAFTTCAMFNADETLSWIAARKLLLSSCCAFRGISQNAQQLLNNNFLAAIQDKVSSALNIAQVVNAVTSADWEKIDGWLVARLSAFFGETLNFNRLDAVRGTIHAVLERRQSLYVALSRAVARNYEAKFAALYDSS